MLSKKKILVVDDEADILEFLSYNLVKEGAKVYTADNGLAAIEIARSKKPDLILLDVMMPEMDGVETCMQLREKPDTKNIIIAFLTARGEDYSQIAGFEAGADDYITKPIKPRVLISRLKALLRRKESTVQTEGNADLKSLKIDRDRYVIVKDDVELNLPKKEFELIALLISVPGKVFTREVILSSVWGEDVVVGDRTIDVHIRKLREKIGSDHIKTIKGVGYKFEE
ncbi:MAG: response regulator transcription factor [Salibacteraceae bacterium]|nr:response regulator transcription factor [Salibacteraceae bacterium]MDP4686216.1 response regulator transcription factor [Salibacteraceae bacterium]MDP4762986.1 response regulator transcription factor [Salibacteraceae bacterium]MDP4844593.1 response regulator transcription factor [Salibacteraceae bacterium]MDP4934137.1 response regulator transcription factor [Salibacteraceae bacterium]